ncbi:hypothetical protein A4G19_07055 [Pasteurellaceae bacterium Macca]|nr:hypothetical protein [Pasteurellaceae bacterium Macca]
MGWFSAEKITTPQWTSHAQVEAPKVADLGNYYSLANIYYLIKGEVGNGTSVDNLILNNVYSEFKRQLISPDTRQNFLNENEVVKQIAHQQNQPVALIAMHLLDKFTFDESAQRLSFTLENPEQAKTILAEFIQFTSTKARNELNTDLIVKWKILFQQVKQSAENHLGAIQQGNQIAQQDWSGKLNLMRSVQPLDDKLQAFRFIQSPTVPLVAEKAPYQRLFTAIGGGLGFLISLLFCCKGCRRKKTIE